MRVLDLFSGVGGFSLGLELAGMKTVAFCEKDKKARLVLKKWWPDVPIYEDVRKLTYEKLKKDRLISHPPGDNGHLSSGLEINRWTDKTKQIGMGGKGKLERNGNPHIKEQTIDLICGGFPCQPFSQAGLRRGAEDDRHLWPEYFRLIQEIRPRWVLGENVAGIVNLGLDQVLSDLESAHYSCQTIIIPACALNAPHRRDRVWIIANAEGDRAGKPENFNSQKRIQGGNKTQPDLCGQNVSHPQGFGMEGGRADRKQEPPVPTGQTISGRNGAGIGGGYWEIEPGMGRVADGVPNRVDRLKQLGNAVVPQIVEVIGNAIMEIEKCNAPRH